MSLKIETLRTSFKEVTGIADQVADHFYETLFKDYPQVKALFVKVRMDVQKKALINSLVMIVDSLDQEEKLSNYLKGMGARHFDYSVSTKLYPAVGATLIKTFKHFFKDKWTKELESAWTEAYGAISQLMIQGHQSVSPDLSEIRAKAKKVSEELLLEILGQELEGEFQELVRARVRQVLLSVLREESEQLLKKVA